ncbi:MAG TPA: hypothetical protein VMB25_19825 [Bryobacteraceae bacterium]|nr:hypothetical protein [Bryobacteraceae bacterium]
MCRMRVAAAATFFSLYLAVQIAVPAVQIFRHDNAFRWSMFAESGESHDIFLEYPDGSREGLADLRKRTGRNRLLRSLVHPATLRTYLCSETPKPTRIVVRGARTAAEEQYECH